jgi:hypothetical protein
MTLLGQFMAADRAKEPDQGMPPAPREEPVPKKTYKNLGYGWTIKPSEKPSPKPQERKREGLDSLN